MKFIIIILFWAAIGYLTIYCTVSKTLRLYLINIALIVCGLLAITISVLEALVSIISFAIGIFITVRITTGKNSNTTQADFWYK